VYASREVLDQALRGVASAERVARHSKTGDLTSRAWKLSLANYQASRSYKASPLGEVEGQFTVKHCATQKSSGAVYNVNVANKTCSCFHWQQSGVPCIHAFKAIAPAKATFESKYYYEFCTIKRVKAMFSGYRAMTMVHMADVDREVRTREHEKNPFPQIFPGKKQVEKVGRSDKRFASTGDTAAGGGVSQSTAKKRKKNVCPSCCRVVARGNKEHIDSEACCNYATRNKTGSLYTSGVLDVYHAARAPALPVAADDAELLDDEEEDEQEQEEKQQDEQEEEEEQQDQEEEQEDQGEEQQDQEEGSDSESDSDSGAFSWLLQW
jgi:hypothetical protein